MQFRKSPIKGAWVIDIEPLSDERGFFARSFCAREFEKHGLSPSLVQCNLSYNRRKGTLRGLHCQIPPAAEPKLVRCTAGAIYDVIVDLRPDSPGYLRHFGVELTAENRRALYVPELCAHGFQTLTDDTEVTYQMGAFYQPEFQRGFRYDDPAFSIQWPLPVSVISEKDLSWDPLEQ